MVKRTIEDVEHLNIVKSLRKLVEKPIDIDTDKSSIIAIGDTRANAFGQFDLDTQIITLRIPTRLLNGDNVKSYHTSDFQYRQTPFIATLLSVLEHEYLHKVLYNLEGKNATEGLDNHVEHTLLEDLRENEIMLEEKE